MELNYDPIFPDCPVVDRCLSVWARHAAFRRKPAFVWVSDSCEESAVLSYGRLDSLAAAVSTWIINVEGLRRGDRVLLLYPPGLDFISVVFGCQRAGIAVIPLMPPSASSKKIMEFEEIVRETSPVAVLAPDSSDGSEYLNVRWIVLQPDRVQSLSSGSIDRAAEHSSRADDLFLIQYTSGSTGTPKPVLISAGAAAHNVRAARRAYDLQPSSAIVSWLPQYHDCGLMFVLLTIVSGATTYLTSPYSFAARPWLWIEMLSKLKATCTVVPAFALPLVESKLRNIDPSQQQSGIDLSNLQSLILINEPILAANVGSFVDSFSSFGLRNDSIAPSYGLAENCTFVCTAWRKTLPVYGELLPSGKISGERDDLLEMTIKVVDPRTSVELPRGEEGEVWIRSPSNGIGYLDDPALSSATFKARIQGSGDGFLRSGDTGVISSDGFLFVTGRIKDQLVLDNGSRKIHPQYLESTAYSISPLLRRGCAAIFQSGGELVLIVEIAAGGSIDAVAHSLAAKIFLELLRKHEAEVWTIVVAPPRSIPKTTSGKLRRSEARRMFLAGEIRAIKRIAFRDVLAIQEDSFPPLELLRSSL